MDKVSCIYCIVHKLDKDMENIYIGSTRDLRHRKSKHKSVCNKGTDIQYNYKVYKYIRENGGIDNFEFTILEECEVEKLKRLEQSYMDVYKPSLNSYNADGVDIERHIERRKEYFKKSNNRYIETIYCPCGGRFSRLNKLRHERSKKHQRYLEQNNNISTV